MKVKTPSYPKSLILSCVFCLISFLFSVNISAQRTDSMTVPASEHFKINGSRHFWMGKNYRREWRTPVTVPVISVGTYKGGLTPKERGGGKQTKTLKLEDKQGRRYSIRSVQKFITSKTLPVDLQSEAAVDLVADGISASYPYANLTVPVLAKAAGIPHSESILAYIGDDPALGEFREDFKNMIVFIEKRLPDSVDKDWNSDEVAEKLKEDNDHEVDQLALLKARILDMFVMDLDRHEDQWEWGKWDKEKGNVYYPVARDKDQAFYINEGVIPGIASWPWLVPQLEGFKSEARNINRFNWAARNVDRFFLNELDEQDWKRTVDEFLSKMTDEVIDRAFDQQPYQIRHLRWNETKQKLKERRKYLADEVMEYYRFLSEDVNITTSDKKEHFDITLNDDGSADVKIYKITDEGERSTLLYDRLFDAAVTKEIRLYGFGGDDKFTIRGREDKIKVRMIGGPGKDAFENLTNSGETAIIYDMEGEGNTLNGELKNKLRKDSFAHHYDRLGYNYNNAIPFISAAYNRDDGLYLGVSLKLIRHGFRKDPYKNLHEFAVNHSLSTRAWNFRYYAEFISTFGRFSDLLFDADIKSPNNVTNFFGYGSNSIYDKTKPGEFRFYRARYDLGDVSLLLRKRFSPKVHMTLGPTFQFYNLDSTDNLDRSIYLIPGINALAGNTQFISQQYFGGLFTFVVDSRDNPVLTRKGIVWNNTVRHLSGLGDTPHELTQVNSDFTFHLNLIKDAVVLANRIGGGHNFGDFEFYQSQYLGSEDNLRGYRKYRFAGQSKFFNNTDLRIRVAKFKTYLFGGELGILGFYDTGRIWSDNDNSDQWLSGYGGGFWISPLRRFVITVNYAVSDEDKLPLVHFGWRF